VRDHEAHADGLSVERLVVEELAASVREAADGRLRHGAAGGVREVQAPGARLRVVETQAQRLDMAGGSVDVELDEVGAAVPDLAHDGGAVVLDPGRAAGERAEAALEVRFPGPDLEVEVMLPVVRARRGLGGEGGGAEEGE